MRACLFAIFFVEEASEGVIFVLRLFVNRDEGEDSATKMMVGTDQTTEGHRSWSDAAPGQMAPVVDFYRSSVLS